MSVKIHLMYFEDVQQMIALFDIHKVLRIKQKKHYIKAFRNSDNFMILRNRDGIIYDVNDLHTSIF